ncbi:preprotein translocase subunit YajC [Nocardia ninae]|uniref:Preprotein translocase subunit YajC n=1 Tax=Nocardia ninae NBRC 108245 TaxID=1210091 RepID=A0A511MMV7_9NOCA|nr:preprotein translocase subunit YajC [Nocardia ninae]GEM41467.1 preprotein translocase subunit YajC [Nocardia ninae NBRC 108245]
MELLFPLLLVALLVPMFLGVRRQKREAAKVTEMQDSLKAGDQVITTSGLYGTVVDLDDTTVDLEIAEEVVTTWLRAAIREVRVETETVTDAIDTDSTGATAVDAIEESTEQTQTRLTKD